VRADQQQIFGLCVIEGELGKPRQYASYERMTESWSRRLPELRRDHQAAEADRRLLLEARAPRRSQLRVIDGGEAA
jgi:hypothetical protein